MDFLNKAKAAINSGSNTGATNTNTNVDPNAAPGAGQPNAGAAGGSEDYGDKALDFIEKKTGHTMSREQNEKITDGARGAYEKFSGKQVDAKYSN